MSFVSDAISRFESARVLQQQAAVSGRLDDPGRGLRHRRGTRRARPGPERAGRAGRWPRRARGGHYSHAAMSLGPQGGRGLLATMWRLALARQQLLLVAVAMVLLDASALLGRDRRARPRRYVRRLLAARSTTSRARSPTLWAGRFGGSGACAAAVVLYVAVRPWPLAWLRASYIRGLCPQGRPAAAHLAVGRAARAARRAHRHAARRSRSAGWRRPTRPRSGAPLLLIVLVFTLYADYAIVVDDLSLWQAFRSSLHVLLRRPSASLGVTAVWLVLSFVARRRPRARRSTTARRRSP